MDTRQLGRSGPHLSVVGLGGNNFGWRLDAAATATVVHAALDAGITHIDTAEMYGEGRSEEYIGAALGARRDEVVLATKFLPRPSDEAYTPGALARRIREAVEGSLSRLGTDRIDLYYQHTSTTRTPTVPWARRWRRSPSWSAPARSCTWRARTCPPRRSTKRPRS